MSSTCCLSNFWRRLGYAQDRRQKYDGFIWDEDIMPLYGASFPAFPGDALYEEDTGPEESSQPVMLDATDVADSYLEWMQWGGRPDTRYKNTGGIHGLIPERPRLSREKRTCCHVPMKARLLVTGAMLMVALLTFIPMVTLPMGEGQGAWPLGTNITCHHYDLHHAQFLRLGSTIAALAVVPMVMGIMLLFSLNLALLLGRSHCQLLSAVLCYFLALVHAVYLAVLPYKCASTSDTAALSFSCAYFQLLLILLVPLLQRGDLKDTRREVVAAMENDEDDELPDEATPLLNPATSITYGYYYLTPPLCGWTELQNPDLLVGVQS